MQRVIYYTVNMRARGYPVQYIDPETLEVCVWNEGPFKDPVDASEQFKCFVVVYRPCEWLLPASFEQQAQAIADDKRKLAEWNACVTRAAGEAPTKQTLYTFGYLSSKSERTLQKLKALHVPVVDIRYNPDSRRPEWKRAYLERVKGLSYQWIQDLGNELYKEAITGKFTEPHIKLHNSDRGIELLQQILVVHDHVAIFCACTSRTCHRFTVAELAAIKMPELKIEHL